MEIFEDKSVSFTRLDVRGRLDSGTSFDFEKRLFELISAGCQNIILDFEKLDYISSAGLRVILKGNHYLKSIKGRIVICSMQDYVQEVFEIARLDSFLNIVPRLDDANRYLASTRSTD